MILRLDLVAEAEYVTKHAYATVDCTQNHYKFQACEDHPHDSNAWLAHPPWQKKQIEIRIA